MGWSFYSDLKVISAQEKWDRLKLLIGAEALYNISQKRVILFGVGGVGSWCAEALIRSAVQHLELVDFDSVAPSNINRQLMATSLTIGTPKVDALKERLLTINPDATIIAHNKYYSQKEKWGLKGYDLVIDCIDTLPGKVGIAIEAAEAETALISSMGAGRKFDPTQIRVGSIWKTKGCPLARELRLRLRQAHFSEDFLAVYSEEPPMGDERLSQESHCTESSKRSFGSAVHMTASFGMVLAGKALEQLSLPH